MKRNTFCRLPWEGIDISAQNEFKPCCKYRGSVSSTLTDYRSSQELTDLQNEFLSGGTPKKCVRCWNDENAGLLSKRQIDFTNHLVDLPHPPGEDGYKIVSVTFGNTCNLACRTCSSFASSKWGVIEKKLKCSPQLGGFYPHNKYYKNEEYIQDMLMISKTAKLIEISGGEPFITGEREHKHLLRQLLQYSPHEKSIHYITNATKFPDPEFWELWKYFKNVDIQLSLDGVGEKFEYLRWPAKWEEVLANVRKYKEMRSNMGNIQLSISHTISILNVWYVREFIDWCQSEKLPTPYLGLVHTPYHYAINNLTGSIKLNIADHLSKTCCQTDSEHLISFLMQPPSKANSLDDFFYWTSELDEMRAQSFSTTLPEIYKIITNNKVA